MEKFRRSPGSTDNYVGPTTVDMLCFAMLSYWRRAAWVATNAPDFFHIVRKRYGEQVFPLGIDDMDNGKLWYMTLEGPRFFEVDCAELDASLLEYAVFGEARSEENRRDSSEVKKGGNCSASVFMPAESSLTCTRLSSEHSLLPLIIRSRHAQCSSYLQNITLRVLRPRCISSFGQMNCEFSQIRSTTLKRNRRSQHPATKSSRRHATVPGISEHAPMFGRRRECCVGAEHLSM